MEVWYIELIYIEYNNNFSLFEWREKPCIKKLKSYLQEVKI